MEIATALQNRPLDVLTLNITIMITPCSAQLLYVRLSAQGMFKLVYPVPHLEPDRSMCENSTLEHNTHITT